MTLGEEHQGAFSEGEKSPHSVEPTEAAEDQQSGEGPSMVDIWPTQPTTPSHTESTPQKESISPASATNSSPPKLQCMNCKLVYKGFYCPRCGQDGETARITVKSYFTESIKDSLELDRGMAYTVRELLLRPGQAIRAYVEGQRIVFYSPVRFLILAGTLVTIIAARYHIFRIDATENSMDESIPFLSGELLRWYDLHFIGFWEFANEYTTLINILSIPIFALCSYLLFIRSNFNYTENLVLNMYVVCMQLFLLLVIALPMEIFSGAKSEIIAVYTLVTMGYNIWCYMGFYKNLHLKGLLLSVLASVLAYVLQFLAAHTLYYMISSNNLELPPLS